MKLDRKPAKLGVLRRGCGGGGVEVVQRKGCGGGGVEVVHKGIHAIRRMEEQEGKVKNKILFEKRHNET